MDELVARIVNAAGITPDMARDSIGIIFNFLQNEVPEEMNSLIATIPGAADIVAQHSEDAPASGGFLGSLMGMMGGGGGLMGLAGELSSAGLGMGDMHTVGHEPYCGKRLGTKLWAASPAPFPACHNLSSRILDECQVASNAKPWQKKGAAHDGAPVQ